MPAAIEINIKCIFLCGEIFYLLQVGLLYISDYHYVTYIKRENYTLSGCKIKSFSVVLHKHTQYTAQ